MRRGRFAVDASRTIIPSAWLTSVSSVAKDTLMYRVLWSCRTCQHAWWTEGRSLFDVIDTTGKNGCPKHCAPLTGEFVLQEYETVGTRAPVTMPWYSLADPDPSSGIR